MFIITNQPLEQLNLKDGLAAPGAGGFASFEGWVRDHNEGKTVVALEYEAFPILCEKEAKKIFLEAREKFQVIQLKCVHPVGRLNVGDMAVWVGATAAHREEAFAACRYIIDQVKARVPIWKKEYYISGESQWVHCEACSHPVHSLPHRS